mgnify:CR=1 FL=1
MIRILTRPELEEVDDITRILAFHDRLIHSRLLTVLENGTLCFGNRVTVSPAPPTDTPCWQLRDVEGRTFPQIGLHDLIGCPVTGVGYFHYPASSQTVIPYLQFLNRIQLCCFSDERSWMLRHDRPREDAWDVFPLFKI